MYTEDRDPWTDVDFDPSKKARDERKARVAKNERQHEKNLARAQQQTASVSAPPPPTAQRKREIDRTLATTRTSTASLGRFDRKLEGEKKLKGVKRKVHSVHFATVSTLRLIIPYSLTQPKYPLRLKNHKIWQFCRNSGVSLKQRRQRLAATCSMYAKPCVSRARVRAAPPSLGMQAEKKGSIRSDRGVVCCSLFSVVHYYHLF